MIKIYAPQIGTGDCFLLYFQEDGPEQLLVVDSGFSGTYPLFKKNLLLFMQTHDCNARMLLTHIDRDHIGGYKKLFQDTSFQMYDRIAAFYYNSLQSLQELFSEVTEEMVDGADGVSFSTLTSYREAITLETFLKEKQISVKTGLYSGTQIEIGEELKLTFLSPSVASMQRYQKWSRSEERKTATKGTDYHRTLNELIKVPYVPDSSCVNASSLSFLVESNAHKLLFLGDAIPEDICKSLSALGYSEQTPLVIDIVKISHHGSKHNTSPELLSMISSKCFLVNGDHPDKETLARILRFQDKPEFWFNHDIAEKVFTEFEKSEYNIKITCSTERVLK